MNDKYLKMLEEPEVIVKLIDPERVGLILQDMLPEEDLQCIKFTYVKSYPTKSEHDLNFFARGQDEFGYGWLDIWVSQYNVRETIHRTIELRVYMYDMFPTPAKCIEHRVINQQITMNPPVQEVAA